MQLKRADVSKKPYKPPILIIHGTVKDLTKMKATNHMPDNGTRPPSHTGV